MGRGAAGARIVKRKSFLCFSPSVMPPEMDAAQQPEFDSESEDSSPVSVRCHRNQRSFVSDHDSSISGSSDSQGDGSSHSRYSMDSEAHYSSSPFSTHRLSTASVSEGNDSRCLISFKAHQGGICTMAMSEDFLYSGSEDGQMCSWRRADVSEIDRFGSGDGAVKALLVRGSNLFSAHQDHKIRAWRRSSSSQAAQHKMVASLPTVRDYVTTAVQPKSYVKIRRHHKCPWNQHFDTISVLAMGIEQQNGRPMLLYSGSWDRTIKVWRVSDFRCLESIDAHGDAVNALAVALNGLLFSGSADKTIKVWERRGGDHGQQHSLVATLVNRSVVNSIALDGATQSSLLYAGCSDGSIVVWSAREFDPHQEVMPQEILRGHGMSVLCVATAGDVVCSGSADRSIRIWRRDEESGRHCCLAVLQEHHSRSPVKSLLVSLDILSGCLVYSGGLDGSIKVWWVSLLANSNNGRRESKERLMESPCSVLDYHTNNM